MVAEGCSRELVSLVVPQAGALVATGIRDEPYRLVGPEGSVVEPAAVFFRDLQAAGCSELTIRSYGMDLLRWFRFLRAVGVSWDRASRAESRDFIRWLQLAGKPSRPHWRRERESGERALVPGPGGGDRPAPPDGPGTAAGRSGPGRGYARSTVAHCETVLRTFYEFHRECVSGPIVNPFPLVAGRAGGRAHAHRNPMEPLRRERAGLYRPRVPSRVPRNIPDEAFNEVFARLPSNRDRALVAFFVSTGARAAELLGARQGDVDAGGQLISVVRKGNRAVQQLPASADAFVWLRLYQAETGHLVPAGAGEPLWWTLRRPYRPLSYHAAHRMFERAGAELGADWTLHDLRHTAAYRMAEDPALPLSDVQFVLGHAQLTTTQIYLTPRPEAVIRRVLDHHAGQPGRARREAERGPAPGYRPESLDVLFARNPS
jgi:integrase